MSNIVDVRAITRPQRSYQWEVSVEGLSTGGLPSLTFYAKTVSIPQTSVETISINHKGLKTNHAGRDASSHTVSLTFWDDEAQTIQKFFLDWLDKLILNPLTGGGVSRELYAANMTIRLRNAEDNADTAKITLGHVFPTEISEINLSYDSSEPVEISVTLSYDEKVLS